MKNEKCFLQMTNLFPVDDEIPTAVNDLFLANEKKSGKVQKKTLFVRNRISKKYPAWD
jgi:hypothetical protein